MAAGPYSEKVMDHFMNPRNVGEIDGADGVGEVGNPACGDMMRLYLKIDGGKVVDAKFRTFGCGAVLKTLGSAKGVREASVADLASVPKITPKLAQRIHDFFHPAPEQGEPSAGQGG